MAVKTIKNKLKQLCKYQLFFFVVVVVVVVFFGRLGAYNLSKLVEVFLRDWLKFLLDGLDARTGYFMQ